MRRAALLTIVFALVLVGACRWLLPERYAVNAPVAHMLFGKGGGTPEPATVKQRLHPADGFEIRVFAGGIAHVRTLRFTPSGDLLATTPRSGEVWLLQADRNGDGESDGRRVVLDNLNRPSGIDLHGEWLYVGETDGVGRIAFDSATGQTSGAYQRIIDDLPSGGNHWTRTVGFGPDGLMYVTVGSSCNVCEEQDQRRAAMLRFQPDGSKPETFAKGLRNSVGFAWQPDTGALYATDNGRDLLGDDFPPCELNHIEQGGFYGWPYANGSKVVDPDLGAGHEAEIASSRPPAHGFRAHNAPLGIAFVSGNALAPELPRSAAVVALHGSWNRTKKDGYKLVSLHWGADGSISERDLVTGFEQDGSVIGRPVDIAEGPDGALYVSDDFAGAVYRVGRPSAPAATRNAEAAPSNVVSLAAVGGGDAARGRALWNELACATCHEPDASQPNQTLVALRGLSSRYTTESLVAFLAAPTPPMPSVERSPEERRDLAAHLLAAHP
jgi:glucose/arabinose dehydrogenase